ncbi:MAG: DUF507 family protein [Myxococcota bacterium]|nr:DUF507 family protein [Myxococcota bacterium]
MKIYRKVIPRISKDVIRALLANRSIEIEEGRRDEAELDIAGVFVRYLNDVDKLAEDALEAIARHNRKRSEFQTVREHLAKKRGLAIGSDAKEYLLTQVIDGLFSSKQILEVFAEDEEIRVMIDTAVSKYLGVDEELDREVRHRLKNLREGTAEWEVEYAQLINQMRYSAKAN